MHTPGHNPYLTDSYGDFGWNVDFDDLTNYSGVDYNALFYNLGISDPEMQQLFYDQYPELFVQTLADAGYNMEDDEYSPNTVCVEFPVHEPYFQKGKRSVSMWEQLEMAAQYQHYWADNSVSITVTFKPEEAPQIKDALEMYETRLKAVSFLKYEETGYVQAPYEPITKKQYEKLIKNIQPIQRFDTDEGGSGTKFCTNDSCTI